MADTKFSDLPAVTSTDPSDILCIVASGVSSQIEQQNILHDTSSNAKGFTNNSGFVKVFGDGGFQVFTNVGASGELGNTANTQLFHWDSNGFITIESGSAASLRLESNTGFIELGTSGQITIEPASGQNCFISYTPLTPSDWSGSPTSVWEALDRIAAAIFTLQGGVPIA
jgi:hypothetical protein